MKKATKILLIIAICLVFVGGSAFCITMAANDWDFGKIGNGVETVTYDVKDDFGSISISSETEIIELVRSTDESCRVVCDEREKEPHDVYVENGTLIVKKSDSRKWFDYITFFSVGSQRITIYLPKTQYDSLKINESTGDIKVPADFTFSDVNIDLSTGEVDFRASASGMLHIESSTGDLSLAGLSAGEIDLIVSTGHIDVANVECKGNIRLSVSTGRAVLEDVTCAGVVSTGSTGDITLRSVVATGMFDIERSTGEVIFDGSDASELRIRTDTGDVTGSLLTDKVFIVRTDTGDVDVPETTTGGKCKITTDTGDIEITTR